jgi:hypothetical protein
MRSTPSEELVLRAYSGRKTEKEALRLMKGRLKTRQQRTVRKRLLDRKELFDFSHGRKGRGAHEYQPTEEILPQIKQIIPGRMATPDALTIMLLGTVNSRVLSVRRNIEKNRAWSRPRRIKSICLSEINPVVQEVLLLRGNGIKVTLPEEFFHEGQPRYLRRLLRSSLDLRGPLAVQVQGEDKKVTTIYPDLIGWHQYLKTVVGELALEEAELLHNAVFPETKPKSHRQAPRRGSRKQKRDSGTN